MEIGGDQLGRHGAGTRPHQPDSRRDVFRTEQAARGHQPARPRSTAIAATPSSTSRPTPPSTPQTKTVDVTLQGRASGPEVYIDKIEITGNTKTRDKVIRRELELQEQQRFSGSKLRRSQERLRRLGFFEDVNITTRKAEKRRSPRSARRRERRHRPARSPPAPGISLGRVVPVQRAPVGDQSVRPRPAACAQRRLRRRSAATSASTSPSRTSSTPQLTARRQPIQLAADLRRVHARRHRRRHPHAVPVHRPGLEPARAASRWTTPASGSTIASSRPRSPTSARLPPSVIRAEQGSSLTSSITPRIFRDTRNHPFDPTNGSLQDFSFEFAGLGGDSKFIKAESRTRWYYPFWKSPRFGDLRVLDRRHLRLRPGLRRPARAAAVRALLPGRHQLGARLSASARSARAFPCSPEHGADTIDAARRQPVRPAIRHDVSAAASNSIFNNEIIFPLVQSLGLKGVVFFDAGNAFSAATGHRLRRHADRGRRRACAGLSPIGPLRIELGFPLNPRVGDDTQTVMFSFGGPP